MLYLTNQSNTQGLHALMTAAAPDLATKLSRIFDARAADALCAHYTFPLPVQMGETLQVFQRPQDLGRAFSDFRTRNAALGLTQPNARIAATELPRNGRFRVWVDWTYQDATSGTSLRERAIYYCSQIGRSTGIEMIQCSGTIANRTSAIIAERRSA
jgi:hypothetical protein